eukprot:234307_1
MSSTIITKCLLLLSSVGAVLSTNLETVYAVNTTLSTTNNPYYVNNDVTITEGTIFTVENGVQIIFNGNYFINIRGKIIVGCNSFGIDTYSSNYRGLRYNTKTTISGTMMGGFVFSSITDSDGEFCNVLFDGFDSLLKYDPMLHMVDPPNQLTFDNCEFTNINQVNIFGFMTSDQFPTFTDSKFYDIHHVVSMTGSVRFDNCYFERVSAGITPFGGSAFPIQIFNSEIIGEQNCLHIGNTWEGFEP